MGTDLNIIIEYKNSSSDSNDWLSFSGAIFSPHRNYKMFSLMANVRSENRKVIYHAKGLPPDISYFTKLNVYEDADSEIKKLKSFYHDHSWLDVTQFENCINNYEHEKAELIEYFSILAAMREFVRNGFDSRIVFWFDS